MYSVSVSVERNPMWERFASTTRRVVKIAHDEAERLGSEYVGTEHLLLGIVADQNPLISRILSYGRVNRETLLNDLMRSPLDAEPRDVHVFSDHAKMAIESAWEEARHLGEHVICPIHLLLGILCVKGSTGFKILNERGVTYSVARYILAGIFPVPTVPETPPLQPAVSEAKKPRQLALSLIRALRDANDEARRMGSDAIYPEHLLLGILKGESSLAVKILYVLDVNIKELQAVILGGMQRGEAIVEGATLDFSKTSKEVVAIAHKEAGMLRSPTTGAEHLLLGILSRYESRACNILGQHLITYVDALRLVSRMSRPAFGVRKPYLTPPSLPEWERLSSAGRHVLRNAFEAVRRFHNEAVYAEHILLGLLKDRDSSVVIALQGLGIDTDALEKDVSAEIPQGSFDLESPTYSRDAREVLALASREATNYRQNFIDPEHILLGLLHARESNACDILTRHGLKIEDARRAVDRIIKRSSHGEPPLGPLAIEEEIDSEAYGVRVQPGPARMPHQGRIEGGATRKVLTPSAQMILFIAHKEARRAGSSVVQLEHLLISLLESGGTLVPHLVASLGVDIGALQEDLRALVPRSEETPERFSRSPRVDEAVRLAEEEARQLGEAGIGAAALLIGILRCKDEKLSEILDKHGLTLEKVRSLLHALIRASVERLEEQLPPREDTQDFDAGIYQEIIDLAREEAEKLGAESLNVDHLLLALLKRVSGKTGEFFLRYGVTYDDALEFISGKRTEPPQQIRRKIPSDELSVFSAMESLAPSARSAMEAAIRETLSAQCCRIEPEHLVLGVISSDEGQVADALKNMNVDAPKLREALKAVSPSGESGGSTIVFSASSAQALEASIIVARQLGHELVSAADLLLGVLSLGQVRAVEILAEHGVEPESFRNALLGG
jgi:ATP-dependent Clp protease ATP-binding subunit ClpC